jgi:putative PIN family toxin of toxin-antitoxin system
MLTDLRFDVYVCDRLLNEICDVARRDKIRKKVSQTDVKDLLAIIRAFCRFVEIDTKANPSSIRDPKDLYLLSLAETIGADYIVSGDADLIDLGQHQRTKMIKFVDFKTMMLY